MPIIYRKDSPTPLTADQVDDNFRYLEEKLAALEARLSQPDRIVDMYLKGEEIFIHTAAGNTFGPFTLPHLKPWIPKGLWKENILYGLNDVVSYDNSLYLCIVPKSQSGWESEEWQLICPLTPSQSTPCLKVTTQTPSPPRGTMGLLNIAHELIPAYFDGDQWLRIPVENIPEEA